MHAHLARQVEAADFRVIFSINFKWLVCPPDTELQRCLNFGNAVLGYFALLIGLIMPYRFISSPFAGKTELERNS